MVVCSTVAKLTQIRYGIIIYVTHRICGYIATIAQINVPNTKKISSVASGRFFNPNCIGVKRILKIVFKINGATTATGIASAGSAGKKYRRNTAPNETIIPAYNNVHTGPNIHDGGAHAGFTSSA